MEKKTEHSLFWPSSVQCKYSVWISKFWPNLTQVTSSLPRSDGCMTGKVMYHCLLMNNSLQFPNAPRRGVCEKQHWSRLMRLQLIYTELLYEYFPQYQRLTGENRIFHVKYPQSWTIIWPWWLFLIKTLICWLNELISCFSKMRIGFIL